MRSASARSGAGRTSRTAASGRRANCSGATASSSADLLPSANARWRRPPSSPAGTVAGTSTPFCVFFPPRRTEPRTPSERRSSPFSNRPRTARWSSSRTRPRRSTSAVPTNALPPCSAFARIAPFSIGPSSAASGAALPRSAKTSAHPTAARRTGRLRIAHLLPRGYAPGGASPAAGSAAAATAALLTTREARCDAGSARGKGAAGLRSGSDPERKSLLRAGGDLPRALRDAPNRDGGFSPLTLAWILQRMPAARLAEASGLPAAEAQRLDRFREELALRLARVAGPGDLRSGSDPERKSGPYAGTSGTCSASRRAVTASRSSASAPARA